MSASELDDWREFARLEPFGAIRDNIHAAMLAAITFNANRGTQEAKTLHDFLLVDPERHARVVHERAVAGLLAGSTPAMKGKKLRRRPRVIR